MNLNEALKLLTQHGFLCETKYEIRDIDQIKDWLFNNTNISNDLIEVTSQPAVFIRGLLPGVVIMIKFDGRFINFSYTKGISWKNISMTKRTLKGLEIGWKFVEDWLENNY